MTVYLLDINVLLALSDPMHLHHQAAHRWFISTGHSAWATCPFTENGFIRIASHPSYPNRPGDVPVVMALLARFRAVRGHCFWSADFSLFDVLSPNTLIPHTQITDIYLLGLAVRYGGKLATFDTKISATALQGGTHSLELLFP
jgi:toxin-antitoxin system PIN domain toxin